VGQVLADDVGVDDGGIGHDDLGIEAVRRLSELEAVDEGTEAREELGAALVARDFIHHDEEVLDAAG
jgi:hypothetical protein